MLRLAEIKRGQITVVLRGTGWVIYELDGTVISTMRP
jgi:hypothetical protein